MVYLIKRIIERSLSIQEFFSSGKFLSIQRASLKFFSGKFLHMSTFSLLPSLWLSDTIESILKRFCHGY